jgi:hypothetical protein
MKDFSDIIDGLMIELREFLKCSIFVNHVKSHLKSDEKVICKICNKDIDTIYNERIKEIREWNSLHPIRK